MGMFMAAARNCMAQLSQQGFPGQPARFSGPPPKLEASDLHKIHSQQFQQKALLSDVSRSLTGTGQSSESPKVENPIVEMFILENPPIEPHAAAAIRSLPQDQQMSVITRGS